MHSVKALVSLTFGLAALASRPLAPRQDATTSSCKAFKLVAELTEPSTVESSQQIFGRSVDGWLLTGLHVGAGHDASVFNDTRGTTFFAKSLATTSGAGVFAAGKTSFSMALMLIPVAKIDPSGQSVYFSRISVGTVRPGLGISTKGYLEVEPPAAREGGKWLVFHEKTPVYGRPDFQLRYVEPPLKHELPEDSVAIKLKAQCAGELPPLPADATYDYDGAQNVTCFEVTEVKD